MSGGLPDPGAFVNLIDKIELDELLEGFGNTVLCQPLMIE